jgi:hypothetical protein
MTITEEDFSRAAAVVALVKYALGKRDEYELTPVALMYAAVGGSVCSNAERLALSIDGLTDLEAKLSLLAKTASDWPVTATEEPALEGEANAITRLQDEPVKKPRRKKARRAAHN